MPETQVGLALSGGAVRGAAHCGVLSVFDEEGIKPRVIAGTSAGAAVGAAYAAGLAPARIADMLHGLSWPSVAKFAGFKKRGLYSLSPWADFLAGVLDNATFDTLDIRLVTVSCDLMTGKRVLLTEGDLASAVRASTAIPGLFEPVEDGDKLLVDGGTIDNYPATVPFEFGADVVIGVNVSAQKPLTAPRNPISVLLAAAEIRGRSTGVDVANVGIVPSVSEFSSFDFDAVPEIYQRGREAATEALPEIRSAIEQGRPPARTTWD